MSGLVGIAAALLLATGSPAHAEPIPNPQAIARPAEQEALRELTAILAEERAPKNAERRLDGVLSRLGEPSPLRGFVQLVRSGALLAQGKVPQAREAIEESIRYLPGYSGPLLAATRLEAYADRAEQAADYLLRASEVDPDIVRQIPDYELNNILHRLEAGGNSRRRQQLAERLFAIGWLGENLILRSSLARDLIVAKLEAGDLAAARALLPRLANPADVRSLLVQYRFRAFWPDLERWSGPQLERLWAPFLGELRAKWQASRDRTLALAYVQGLEAAGHHRTIVDEMLPLFSAGLDRPRDYDLLWVASPLVQALARLGRWQDVDALYDRASRVWRPGSDANALNILANRGRFRFYRGDFPAALRDLDAAIADAAGRTGEVSAPALSAMHFYRACALHMLERDSEAIPSIAIATRPANPVATAQLFLCLGREESARTLLIEALRHEELRDSVLAFAQPDETPPMQSDTVLLLSARQQALRADPRLRAAASRYGRILPWTLSAGAPAERAPR